MSNKICVFRLKSILVEMKIKGTLKGGVIDFEVGLKSKIS